MTIKLIIFDLSGVILSGGYKDTMKWFAKRYHRNWKELYSIFYTKYFNQAASRTITQTDAWKRAVAEAGLPLHWKLVQEKHYSLMRLNKPLLHLTLRLAERTPFLLLTKNTRSQFRDVNKRFRIKNYFKNCLNLWELQLPKAGQETYNYLCTRFKVKPQEVVYIDDLSENLVEAKKLRMHTILYQNFKQFKKEFDKILGLNSS